MRWTRTNQSPDTSVTECDGCEEMAGQCHTPHLLSNLDTSFPEAKASAEIKRDYVLDYREDTTGRGLSVIFYSPQIG
jgi:hypothetical protein